MTSTADLAISNIAWPMEVQDEVLERLRSLGVVAIEVAPSKLFADPSKAMPSEATAIREQFEGAGFRIVAAQSLLFGKPDLHLFPTEENGTATLDYLRPVLEIAGTLGAGPLVFGSPKNRKIGDMTIDQAWPIAIEFFRRLAEEATRTSTVVVLEANPTDYGADFLTRAEDAARMVRDVDHPGLRLHLDAACMKLAGDDPAAILNEHSEILHHVHISEPFLAPVTCETENHARFAKALRKSGYGGSISIEMRPPEPFSIDVLANAVDRVRAVYLNTS